MKVLNFFLIVMFGNTGFWNVVFRAVYIAGLYGLFKKCGAPPKYALIPYYRTYVLAECAGREPEGRVVFTTGVFSAVCTLVHYFIHLPAIGENIVLTAQVVLGLISAIYSIRIFAGLCDTFQRRKRWIFGWVFFDWLCALLFGFHEKFVPAWKVEDFQKIEDSFFSGAFAQAMDNGLTVNIQERTVRQFFNKKYLLRDIHLYIKPGHMVLILGGSGAGKTTFLNAVNGYEPARAQIVLNGEDVHKEY